jgi:hypothetical protein
MSHASTALLMQCTPSPTDTRGRAPSTPPTHLTDPTHRDQHVSVLQTRRSEPRNKQLPAGTNPTGSYPNITLGVDRTPPCGVLR